MALTSRITKTVEHPSEAGVTFTLRKLSYRHVEEAIAAKRDNALQMMRSLQGVEIPDPYKDMTPEERTAARAKAERDSEAPSAKYDRATVLKYGVTAWTYDAPVAVDELDEETAAWLFGEIIAHSLRSAPEGEASGSVSTATTA